MKLEILTFYHGNMEKLDYVWSIDIAYSFPIIILL